MSIGTLDKTVKIIELLSKSPTGMSVSEISRALGFPKSTTHHILKTFLKHGFFSQNGESKKYALGIKFLYVSSAILAQLDIGKIAEGHLLDLHEKSHEIVQLYIAREGKMVCTSKVGNLRGLTLSSYVGWVTEPHASAAGKILLSGYAIESLLKIYPDKKLKKFGKNTITDLDLLIKDLEKVRAQGYAIDDEEYYEGVRCISAPVWAGNKVVAAVSCTGPVFRMTMKRINSELIQMVKETAAKISNDLSPATFL